jgi:uncharacterized protein YfaP (DUF2135 family)
VHEGNPRITLQWIGNDDFGLVVVTPDGTVISSASPLDAVSGGVFGKSGVQDGFGKHLENVFFPLTGGPLGIYQYYVTTPQTEGSEDSWLLSVAVNGMDIEIQSGLGSSDIFSFRYGGIAPPGPIPEICTNNLDCMPNQLCVMQSCIEQGTPQFLLLYEGDDDLDLYVITPLGTTIFSQNPEDILSGGKFAANGSGDGVQDNPGAHIEYVYFAPNNGPMGMYQYYVEKFRGTNDDDTWTVTVYVSGQAVAVESGQGSSDNFIFDFDSTTMPALPPSPPPTFDPQECDPATAQCCSSENCFPSEACTFETCVDEGNPRFTLFWEGSNDLDLLVQTPAGTVISFSNTEDPLSGGRFGEEFDQFAFGRHVENIYFPLDGGPPGEYSFYVRSFLNNGMDDVYTVQVFVDGQEEVSFTGTGDSDKLTYVYQGGGSNDDCNIQQQECCEDSQCAMGLEVCTQQTCIDIGVLRFTLEWQGDDDLDLTVQTPLGTNVSFINPLDEETGGVFGEGGAQPENGNHVENIYFSSSDIPAGPYLYSVSLFEQRGAEEDEWSMSVFLNNMLVDIQTGSGISDAFVFVLNDGDIGGPSPDPECDPSLSECCTDVDCASSETCVMSFCVNKGLPRFTLAYTGDDVIDLTVVTPLGTTVSVSNPEDALSTGSFEEKKELGFIGASVQNIYFSEGPSGTYTYFVSIFDLNGDPDEWTVKVYEGDDEKDSFTGSGDANFLYEYGSGNTPTPPPAGSNNPTPSPPPIVACQTSSDECCDDGDCNTGEVCRSRTCITDGNPRFTVTWFGSDDYDLAVTTPTGGTISFLNQFDQESGGRFGENGVQLFSGLHVENVFFPQEGGPIGSYTVEISALNGSLSELPAPWNLEIATGGDIVQTQAGNGISDPIEFMYADLTRSVGMSARNNTPCLSNLSNGLCCYDADCLVPNSFCMAQTCIQEGTIRFTLTWDGNGDVADDLDLVVRSPDNAPKSTYDMSKAHKNLITGQQVQSIGFPLNAPFGLYKVEILSFSSFGAHDRWTLQVFVDGAVEAEHSGEGTSSEINFEYVRPSEDPTTNKDEAAGTDTFDDANIPNVSSENMSDGDNGSVGENIPSNTRNNGCKKNSDCSAGSICLFEHCISISGSFCVTLAWSAKENVQMHFSVITPEMDVLTSYNEMDSGTGSDFVWNFVDIGSNHHLIQMKFIAAIDSGMYQFALSGAGGNFNPQDEGWQFWIHANESEIKHQAGTSVDTSLLSLAYQN